MSGVHSHLFTEKTADPGYKRCGYFRCRAVSKVGKPALAVESSPTSVAAARAIEGGPRTRTKAMVLEAITNAIDGLTDERGQEITGLNGSTYRPRRVELEEEQKVYGSVKTRLTKSGRQAQVFYAR